MNNYLINDPFGTNIADINGSIVRTSRNLRGMRDYARVSPVARVIAHPDPRNPYNGVLRVIYKNGASSRAFFSSYNLMCLWLIRRRSWPRAQA